VKDERIQVGSIVKLANPGDWKVPKNYMLVVLKIFNWGILGRGWQIKGYHAQWDEIEFLS